MATYDTLTADGQTETVWVDGPVSVIASGTWGGGTLTVQMLGRDGNWITLNDDVAMTSDATGQRLYDIDAGHVFRASLSGSTSPDLTVSFFGKDVKAYNV